MTFDQLMAIMQREDDERMAWFRELAEKDRKRGIYHMPADPGLSINAGRAEQLMADAGHSYVQATVVCSGATCHVWDIDDGQVYVLMHLQGYPCAFRRGGIDPTPQPREHWRDGALR